VSEIDPDFLRELQAAFVIEGREQLQSFMVGVINLERADNDADRLALAENMLHDLHSLKGNSRSAGVSSVEAICQALESALLSLRRKNQLLKTEAADVFHAAIDLLAWLINDVEKGSKSIIPSTFSDVLQRLKNLDERQRAAAEAGQPPLKTSEEGRAGGDATAGNEATAAPGEPGARQSKGAVPAAPVDKAASTRIALWKLDKLLHESEEMLVLKQISEQHLQDIAEIKALTRDLRTECLRLSGLLVSGQTGGGRLPAKERFAFADSLTAFCKDFEHALVLKMHRQQTEQRLCFNMVDGLIDSVKALLMQDFSSLFSLIPKVVRDLSRELNKEVDLEIWGSEIEIDRRILEEIKDPLIHLVRNSLDHGIETAEDRLGAGKPARAILRIAARHDESGNVQLIVSDDGRGISIEKLKSAAVKEGAVSAEEALRLTNLEALDLIYRSAVSTSEAVSEISGRGIGMVIVRERIHDLGGRVFVETEPGRGTTFILQLPTKLSTFRGIQVMAGAQSFIIPTLYVSYAGRISRGQLSESGSRNMANLNGQLTVVQGLADVLELKTRREFKTRSARKYRQLLVLEAGERRAGFLVDDILSEHEVLVRGLTFPLRRVDNISGATILGSGQVVPVLNIPDLLETSSKALWADARLRKELCGEVERARRLSEQPVYLVDRHATSLIMLKTLLESEGYLVKTFDSQQSALAKLESDLPLALLQASDLSETSGNNLALCIRRHADLKNLPIIYFGSCPVIEGEELARRMGGDAYFSKVDFNSAQILELVEGLT
jgi:two-component system, chemotaxis family, sensor kinase CheA